MATRIQAWWRGTIGRGRADKLYLGKKVSESWGLQMSA